jgi:hypothetical protein
MSDDMNEAPVDNAANLCGWLVVVTGIMLIIAIITVQTVLKDQYALGWFA